MKIVKIEEINKYKCKVCFETLDSMVLYKKDLHRYQLEEGVVLCDKQVDVFMKEILPYRAKARCMKLLQTKDYTEAEICRKLKNDGYPSEVIQNAVGYLYSYKYLDDERYVRLYYNSKSSKKSRKNIVMDLQQKGISKDVIQKVLNDYAVDDSDIGSDRTCILKLLYKKRYDDLNAAHVEKEKVKAYLYRKGFEADDINHCMRHFNWQNM